MFRLIKTMFIELLSFGGLLVSDGRVAKCVSLNNQRCIASSKFINI